jgi:membrane protease YdiL (CAAX protease family)
LPVAGLACGFTFGELAIGVLASAFHASFKSPGIVAAGTVAVDVGVVAATLLFAGLVKRVRTVDLGLRGAPLKFTMQIAGLGTVAYIAFSLAYQGVVRPKNPQKVVDQLGADSNTLLLVIGAIVVIGVAPVCEELFFRGILFRALRVHLPLWAAAVIDGVLFGLVHGSLVIAPILAFLGIVFCYVYERTGTLFAPIALHAINNTVSYAVTATDGWTPSLVVGGVVIGGCVLGVMRAPRGAPVAA